MKNIYFFFNNRIPVPSVIVSRYSSCAFNQHEKTCSVLCELMMIKISLYLLLLFFFRDTKFLFYYISLVNFMTTIQSFICLYFFLLTIQITLSDILVVSFLSSLQINIYYFRVVQYDESNNKTYENIDAQDSSFNPSIPSEGITVIFIFILVDI